MILITTSLIVALAGLMIALAPARGDHELTVEATGDARAPAIPAPDSVPVTTITPSTTLAVAASPAPEPIELTVSVATETETSDTAETSDTPDTSDTLETTADDDVGSCGGDLPPCWVRAIESNHDYRAYNRRGCGGRGCYGAWQFDPRTWDGYGGYDDPRDAPASVQDAKARELWDNGRGCSHWSGPTWSACR